MFLSRSPSRIAGYHVAPGGYVHALCLLALALFLSVSAKAKAEYVFSTIDAPGSTFTEAHGINTSGQIVGWDVADGTTHGYLLSGGSYTTFDVPDSTYTTAQSINDSGQIVGRYIDAGGMHHGYLRQSDGSFAPPLDPPGSTFTEAYGINASGQIVGLYIDAGGKTHGFLLQSDGSYATFDVPGSILTAAFGINDLGQIVGTYLDAGGKRHGFLLSGDSYTTIDPPGEIVGTFFRDPIASGINNSGQIVGPYTDAGGTTHGFLATPVPAFRITAASTAVSGTPFDVTVTALDASGNIDPSYQGTVTFTTTDPDLGVLLPVDYTFITGDGGDNGVHTFPGGVTLITVGDQTLTVRDTVSGITRSATVTVGPGP